MALRARKVSGAFEKRPPGDFTGARLKSTETNVENEWTCNIDANPTSKRQTSLLLSSKSVAGLEVRCHTQDFGYHQQLVFTVETS